MSNIVTEYDKAEIKLTKNKKNKQKPKHILRYKKNKSIERFAAKKGKNEQTPPLP